jgi:putative intracellular protease/amidase
MITHARTSKKSWPRRVLSAALTLTLAIAVLAGFVLAGAVVTSRNLHQSAPATSTGTSPVSVRYAERGHSASPAATRKDRRLVVAFVAGANGTIASDLLAPYDIFASSPAFTAYVAADVATAVPLEGGPALVPTYTFADVDADPALRPDLVVVPGLSKPEGAAEAPLRRWVTSQHDHGSRVLGVCTGAMVLAATGMLDGLDATSHWSRISALEASRPAVHWERGREYVDDGSVTTSAAVTSGVPAALHLVAELAGRAEAQRVADLHPELNWTPTRSTTIPDDHFAARDWPVGLNYVMPWFRPRIGIALGDAVRTRHGLVLLTTSYADAPGLSSVVVPGAGTPEALDPRLRAWAAEQRLTLEPLAGRAGRDGSGGGGFTAALQNLGEHTDAATTSATAKMIGYPTTGLDLGDRHQSPRTVLLAISALTLAVLVGLGPTWLVRRRRRLRSEGAGALGDLIPARVSACSGDGDDGSRP